jgi:hypothetical protein
MDCSGLQKYLDNVIENIMHEMDNHIAYFKICKRQGHRSPGNHRRNRASKIEGQQLIK